jgi:hypothetical protein
MPLPAAAIPAAALAGRIAMAAGRLALQGARSIGTGAAGHVATTEAGKALDTMKANAEKLQAQPPGEFNFPL